jgi:hypothetical protein
MLHALPCGLERDRIFLESGGSATGPNRGASASDATGLAVGASSQRSLASLHWCDNSSVVRGSVPEVATCGSRTWIRSQNTGDGVACRSPTDRHGLADCPYSGSQLPLPFDRAGDAGPRAPSRNSPAR